MAISEQKKNCTPFSNFSCFGLLREILKHVKDSASSGAITELKISWPETVYLKALVFHINIFTI
jgi:hypothetical protein